MAYFRGRKLRGQEIDVPQGYKGVIVKDSGKEEVASQDTENQCLEREAGEGEQEEVTVLDQVGSFENVIIWNHESMVHGNDAFVKGLVEWIGFAEAVSLVLPECR